MKINENNSMKNDVLLEISLFHMNSFSQSEYCRDLVYAESSHDELVR